MRFEVKKTPQEDLNIFNISHKEHIHTSILYVHDLIFELFSNLNYYTLYVIDYKPTIHINKLKTVGTSFVFLNSYIFGWF